MPKMLSALSLAALLLTSVVSANAQQRGPPAVLSLGNAVVTGFSGALLPDPRLPLPPDRTAIDLTLINPDGPSARVIDLANPGFVWNGRLWSAAKPRDIPAKDTGQVFGVALDDRPEPNIYLAATSAFGLHIVRRGAGGAVERLRNGGPGAQWQDSQFGQALQGGPGSIYKVDGRSGSVSLFADVMVDRVRNPGPGLGGLAYDSASKQLFVSDLYTGLVHRFAIADGAEAGPAFDHGVTAHAAVNAAPVPFDPGTRLDITNAGFDSTDPATWGFAPPERRVWGLAVRDGRLFYSVRNGAASEGPQIWSVGVAPDGSFAPDVRWELDVPAQPGPFSVSDIAFSQRGAIILAQRAPIAGSYDYTAFTTPGEPRVLRFWPESPDNPATQGVWVPVPEEYAVGYAGTYRNSNGGVALGYGYGQDGRMRTTGCEVALWTTGQNLRNDPALQVQLQPGGPLLVHGLQGSPAAPVRNFNEPPATSYFIDYDDKFADPAASGHIGGVRIRTTPCAAGVAYGGPGAASNPPYISGPPTTTVSEKDCPGGLNTLGTCGPIPIDLAIKKTAGEVKYDAATGTWTVQFTLTVTNVGNPFAPLNTISINDAIPPGMTLVSATGTGWSTCTGTLNCGFNFSSGIFATGATLPPLVITLTTKTPGKYRNCAAVGIGYGSGLWETTLANNRDCAEVELERKIDVAIKKTGVVVVPGASPIPGPTTISYTLTVTNVGGAFPGATAIAVTDTPPPGVTFSSVAAVPAGSWSPCAIVAGAVSCTYAGSGPTAPGVIGTITVTATATGNGPWENCAGVSIAPEAGVDVNPADNKACITLTVPKIDVSLAKSFEKGASPNVGTFTLKVKNEADAIVTPGTTIKITDPVPAGVTLNGYGGTSAANWNCVPLPVSGLGSTTCTFLGPFGTFATGALLPDLVLTATLAPAAPGSNEIGIYRNCAVVGLSTGSSTVNETDLANNTACAVTTVINSKDCPGNCPPAVAECKQDVLFIVDSSVSIGGGLGAVKGAIGQFLQAMQNKGGSANIISFNNGGIGTSNPSTTQITPGGWVLVTSGNAPVLAGPIALGGTRTDWDDSLHRGSVIAPTAPLTGKPLVIFVTDGEPTAYINNSSLLEIDASTAPVTASSEAVQWINAIRAGGSPLIAVGFGTVASSGYMDAAFTGSSTGPGNVTLETASVIKMNNVSSLGGVMRTLGNQMCGTLSLNKSISPNTFFHQIPINDASIAVNDTIPFTLTLTNNATTPVAGVVVTDQVPTPPITPGSVTIGTASLGTATASAGNLVTWTGISLGARQTATVTFSGTFVRTYTAPADNTYTNYAQVTAAANYTATVLADMNPVSGPVDEADESSATFRVRVTKETPPLCAGDNQPVSCFLTVNKVRANPGAEDGSCTSSAPGGGTNPCTFNINVGMSNIPPGSTVTVADNLTLSGSSVSWPGTVAPAICTPAPTLVSFSCNHVGLTTFSGPVTVMIPPGQSGPLQNCITVTVTNATTTPPFNVTASSCATVALTQPPQLCPPGTTRRGAACVTPPPPPPVCAPPKIPGPVAGSCVCPQGTAERGRECVKLPPPPPTCAPPKVTGPIAGSCVCPQGTAQRGGECVKLPPPPPACTPPKVPGPVAGRCVCPRGTVERGRECVRTIECNPPARANRAGTACMCPQGTIARGRECLPERVQPRLPPEIFAPGGPRRQDPRGPRRDEPRGGTQGPAGAR
jgi:uncharacterized repeat protein (TIGR01451 family)